MMPKAPILLMLPMAMFAHNLMPVPAKLQPGAGRMRIDRNFAFVQLNGYREPRLEAAAARLVEQMSRKTGIPMAPGIGVHAPAAPLVVYCDHASSTVQSTQEDESYRLTVTSLGARLDAPNPLGVLHGMQTFLQLVDLDANGFGAPAVTIEDHPRFPWRGLMLDVARHWMPLTDVKRTLDGMAAVKLNVFHWHLSENQGFRIESKRFPKLQELGSDGQYYTQDQVRDAIAYARERGIRVIPEFDMPGHATAWFVGYPELASAPGPYQIERQWGIFDPAMDPTREETYQIPGRLHRRNGRAVPRRVLPHRWRRSQR
jgi:hexosaminidase